MAKRWLLTGAVLMALAGCGVKIIRPEAPPPPVIVTPLDLIELGPAAPLIP